MSRAIEKEGVLRKPIANATPEGIQRAYVYWLCDARVLMNDIKEKRMAKDTINVSL